MKDLREECLINLQRSNIFDLVHSRNRRFNFARIPRTWYIVSVAPRERVLKLKVSIRSVSPNGSLTSRLCEKRIFEKHRKRITKVNCFPRGDKFIVRTAEVHRRGRCETIFRGHFARPPGRIRRRRGLFASDVVCVFRRVHTVGRKPVARSITVRTRGACTPLLNCSLAPMNYLPSSLSSSS